jgi:hypothetical protein
MTKKINDSDLNSFDAPVHMMVSWSRHAKLRFAERALMLGINYGDIEFEIKRQEVKLKEDKNKFKTIFKIQDSMLTAVKTETDEYIHVLTLWESSDEETQLWKKR